MRWVVVTSLIGMLSSSVEAYLLARNSRRPFPRLFSSTPIEWTARRQDCWRPDVNDVERISWGKPAKKKGTGSRGVPHRLNNDERTQFDLARGRGFLEVKGSAWRSQRREAPLLNTYRSLCDARGQPSIILHKGNPGEDALVLDLSPLRTPVEFSRIAQDCASLFPDPDVCFQEGMDDDDEVWWTRPIYQLPPFCVAWELGRSEAKTRAKELAIQFGTAEGKRAKSKKPTGVKPGKSRRHGGYGIG